MDIKTTVTGADAVLVVSGSLNTTTARGLEEAVEDVLAKDGVLHVTFDFAALDYISSAGLRVLMGAYKRLVPAGGSVKVAHPTDDVREVFDITGLAGILEIG